MKRRSSNAGVEHPSLFLMVSTFETGGSERQFVVLSRMLASGNWQVFRGCIRNVGALGQSFVNIPEFRLNGSLYGVTSLFPACGWGDTSKERGCR